MEVDFNGNRIITSNVGNLASYLNLRDGSAFFGFSGGTGAATAVQEILTWSFSSDGN